MASIAETPRRRRNQIQVPNRANCMKTIKGIFAVAMFLFFAASIFSCAPSTIERRTKAKVYSFAKKCKKGTCEAYGASKRGTYQKANYGF